MRDVWAFGVIVYAWGCRSLLCTRRRSFEGIAFYHILKGEFIDEGPLRCVHQQKGHNETFSYAYVVVGRIDA